MLEGRLLEDLEIFLFGLGGGFAGGFVEKEFWVSDAGIKGDVDEDDQPKEDDEEADDSV